jgi:porin
MNPSNTNGRHPARGLLSVGASAGAATEPRPSTDKEVVRTIKTPTAKSQQSQSKKNQVTKAPDSSRTLKAVPPVKQLNGGHDSKELGIAGNPAAVNVMTGTGSLGRLLGLKESSGARLGGLWIGNADIQMSGRLPGSASFNSLGIVDLQLDMATIAGIPGASFAATFLQFDGEDSNGRAGVLTGYNGLTETEPLNRSELYQLWWRQSLLDEKLIIRVGKSIPTFDFNNVSRRLPIPDEKPYIAAVTGLLFTPIYVNPSILGVMPGYYNSAWGLTLHAAPTPSSYINYGFYDGSLARGRQTGTHAWPTFNSHYFTIGEVGTSWAGDYPGKVGVGGWGQTGTLGAGANVESGAQGIYATASNRLWTQQREDGAGAYIGYLQYGINNSRTMMVNEFVGGGVAGFGVIPYRPKDSLGFGIGVSWLNNPPISQETEILTQFYYQAHLIGDIFFQPTFTYVPNPGIPTNTGSAYPAATSMIFQLVALF